MPNRDNLKVVYPDGSTEILKPLCRQRDCNIVATKDVTYYIRGYALDVLLCEKHWESFKRDMVDLII